MGIGFRANPETPTNLLRPISLTLQTLRDLKTKPGFFQQPLNDKGTLFSRIWYLVRESQRKKSKRVLMGTLETPQKSLNPKH